MKDKLYKHHRKSSYYLLKRVVIVLALALTLSLSIGIPLALRVHARNSQTEIVLVK